MPPHFTPSLDRASIRFWGKVNFDGPLWNGTPCWVWTAGKNRGYGRTFWDGRHQYAHRISYELLVGPIPDGLTIDHLCRNRACENPGHLEPVTMRVNWLRGNAPTTYYAIKTHCVKGHPFDEVNTYQAPGKLHRACRICRRRRTFNRRRMRRLLGVDPQ